MSLTTSFGLLLAEAGVKTGLEDEWQARLSPLASAAWQRCGTEGGLVLVNLLTYEKHSKAPRTPDTDLGPSG